MLWSLDFRGPNAQGERTSPLIRRDASSGQYRQQCRSSANSTASSDLDAGLGAAEGSP